MGDKRVIQKAEIGDLIRWYEFDYPYYFTYEDYKFKAPKYGIVMEVHIPTLTDEEPEDYDFGFGTSKNILRWEDDMAWIKVLTIGENLQKRYIYLDFDERYEIISKVRWEKAK